MKFQHDGLQLWYGTPDAPAPAEQIEADTAVTVTVAACPADPNNHVEVIYRINGGSTRRQNTIWWRNDSSRTQYFNARLGPFRPGDLVEYGAICHCAGRQVPSTEEISKLLSSFHVTNGETPSQTPAPRTVVRAPAVGSPNLAPPSPQFELIPIPPPPPPPGPTGRAASVSIRAVTGRVATRTPFTITVDLDRGEYCQMVGLRPHPVCNDLVEYTGVLIEVDGDRVISDHHGPFSGSVNYPLTIATAGAHNLVAFGIHSRGDIVSAPVTVQVGVPPAFTVVEPVAGATVDLTTGGPCPQPPPPPRVCNRVICSAATHGWGYQPLAAGTPCQGTGVCDRHGSCVMPQPTQLAIPSDQLNFYIAALLGGSELWLDASGNSPPLRLGHHWECTDPPGPIPQYCWQVADVAHSYIRFSDTLKNEYLNRTQRTLSDYALPHLSPFCNSVACLTVNQISGNLGDARVLFGQWSGGPYARLSMPLHSPSSTVIVNPGPDVQLTNMQVSVDITLMPTVDQSGNAAVEGTDVQAVFDFDANINNFPDWLVGIFYDLSDDIKARVRDGVRAAFADQDRRNALTNVLTSAINSYAKQIDPGFTGFASIIYISVSDGTLLIHYVPT
jgi:hypothetical protein